MRRFLALMLLLTGCAGPRVLQQEIPPGQAAAVPAHPPREILVYVPMTDDGAANWLKWFAKYPTLRMVIAMSPRFQKIAKDPHLKNQFVELQKSGRLELAMQIPNAPILPLLVDNPHYSYPDDIVQLVAQNKADFFRHWNYLPKGLVLPYGAVNVKLMNLLERLGLAWIVAAVGASPADGPYQWGPLAIWDGHAPGGKSPGRETLVKVWDEREMKDKPLDGWVANVIQKNEAFLLPSDSGIVPVSAPAVLTWKPLTWTTTDWSPWIGDPAKNAGWDALRKTREAVENYKNSGQASVQRLDAAFGEIYAAQNSNYFYSMGNSTQSPALVEDRQHEFQATLATAYRLIGQTPPDDLFQATMANLGGEVRMSSTTVHAELLPNGREHVLIEDAVGDSTLGIAGPDLSSVDVWSSSTSIQWRVTMANTAPVTVDIYVDLNGQPNVGTPTLLPGREIAISPVDAWEYALTWNGPTATLYRTQGMGAATAVQTFPVIAVDRSFRITIPAELMRGSPRRWGYQVLAISTDPDGKSVVADFVDPEKSTGQRSELPFIRLRSR